MSMSLPRRLHREPTAIVDRLALPRRASPILVLECGRIIEQGTHDFLLAQAGKYTAMFESQARLYGSTPLSRATRAPLKDRSSL